MNMKPKKSYSQNFLINQGIIQKIIDASDLSVKKDIVLEIGPGKGILTEQLIKNTKKVIAVEKDKELFNFLENKFKNTNNLELINADILQLDLTKYISNNHYKLIANIPYNITGQIFRKFLLTDLRPEMLVIMVQDEVGDRLLGRNKSMVSLLVELYGKALKICRVSPGSFFPEPKVYSAVIKLIKGKVYKNELQVLELAKIGFANRRKKLISNLFKNVQDISTGEEITKKDLEVLFKDIKLKETVRAEELSLIDWLKLAEIINKK